VPEWVPPEVDPTVAHPARVYDYLLGGKDNFEVDREAAEVAMRAVPAARKTALENRAFLGRAVRFLAEAGVTQFLDVGTGIPGPGNTGEVARAIHPESRVVYVDYDPIVATHARALLAGDTARTAVVLADVREPGSILDNEAVRALLDFGQPVAVLMVALLHFVTEEEDAPAIVSAFREALAPGSALVITHGTDGGQPERANAARKGWDNAKSRITVRSPERIEALFDGFELVEPGVVNLPRWRPDGEVREDWESIWLHGGVAYKR
jgi:hypothetical protein